MRICTVDGCPDPVKAKSMCSVHYKRTLRNGDPLVQLRVRHKGTPAERMIASADQTDTCWTLRKVGTNGYGSVRVDGRTVLAHRYSYEIHVGPIPEGLVIDHLCKNKGCIRPDHLEPVTQRENVMRGDGPSAANAAKDNCSNGHAFDIFWTTARGQAKRDCSACRSERWIQWSSKYRTLAPDNLPTG